MPISCARLPRPVHRRFSVGTALCCALLASAVPPGLASPLDMEDASSSNPFAFEGAIGLDSEKFGMKGRLVFVRRVASAPDDGMGEAYYTDVVVDRCMRRGKALELEDGTVVGWLYVNIC